MRQLQTSLRLAELLSKQRDEIIANWLKSIQNLKGSQYQTQPKQELEDWLTRGFDVVVEALNTGSMEGIDAHAVELSWVRMHLGFEIGEVIQGLLLLNEVTVPLILSAQKADTTEQVHQLQCLDVVLSLMVGRFSRVFSNAAHRSLERLATLEERHRVARELHDSVSQSLYGATMYSEAAVRVIETGNIEKGTRYLRDARDTALEALREMRLLIFELHPPNLENQGLVARLNARLASVEGRAGVKTKFDAQENDRLPEPVENELYGIAQEALNNALKHSNACCVTLRLRRKGANAIMEIIDDGIGFDSTAAKRTGVMGLFGMAERVKKINAELSIVSNPGDGTRITVRVPVEQTR